jgi:hypothetical protein
MAVGTHGRVDLSSLGQLPVNTLPIILLDGFVTLAAGARNSKMVNSGLRVSRGQDAVRRTIRRMAVLAGGGFVDAPRGSFAVHAGSICFYGVFYEEFVVLCKAIILMAVGAGVGHIQGVDVRPLVRRFEDLVSAMAIGTCGEIAVQLDS